MTQYVVLNQDDFVENGFLPNFKVIIIDDSQKRVKTQVM